ncbi:hypothetical protein ACTXT7_014873 [Hymenolepis weldensis]
MPWNVVAKYPRGMSQLIGADIVDDMAIATAYTKHSYLNEDVYLGLTRKMQKMKERDYIEFVDGIVVKGEMVLKSKYGYQAF